MSDDVATVTVPCVRCAAAITVVALEQREQFMCGRCARQPFAVPVAPAKRSNDGSTP